MLCPVSMLGIAASLLLYSNSATALALELPTGSANAKTLSTRQTRPIDVNDACKWEHGASFSAYVVGSGCNDWVCQSATEQRGVDMRKWCWDETDSQDGCGIEARCDGGVYSWVCWYGPENCR